jgi:hypothetical protein
MPGEDGISPRISHPLFRAGTKKFNRELVLHKQVLGTAGPGHRADMNRSPGKECSTNKKIALSNGIAAVMFSHDFCDFLLALTMPIPVAMLKPSVLPRSQADAVHHDETAQDTP